MYRCLGCSREIEADDSFACLLDHSARLDGDCAYGPLCVQCLPLHRESWAVFDMAHAGN